MPIEEVRTEAVDVEQLCERVSDIVNFLHYWGYHRITVICGWGCELPEDELWHPIEIETLELNEYIERSEQKGIFRFGRSDLHIEDPQKTLEFRLCHESDLHFGSNREEL